MQTEHTHWFERIVFLLSHHKATLAVAESCTGGGLSYALTSIPGSSQVFLGGIVAYANEAKTHLLCVSPKTLQLHGAVSVITCREMLIGTKQAFKSSYAIAITGIAGPEGGTPEKPVGTVFIGILTPQEGYVYHCLFEGDRHTIREQSILFAGKQLVSLFENVQPSSLPPFLHHIINWKLTEVL